MTRPSTRARDAKILELYDRGMEPKQIATVFQVTVWVVYKAVGRVRSVEPQSEILENRDEPNN